jgi:hypothetical protein
VAALQEIVWMSFLWLLFVGSLAALAAGIGLVFSGNATLAFFVRLNRWVSSRAVMKPMEVPHLVGNRVSESKRRWVVGLIFVVGGLYASLLLGSANISGSPLFRTGQYAVLYALLFDSLRLFLLVTSAAAAVMGILLLFFPAGWARLEALGNRWYSTRQVIARGEVMHFPIDRWVESSPRYAGGIITMLALVGVVAFGILLYVKLKLGLR